MTTGSREKIFLKYFCIVAVFFLLGGAGMFGLAKHRQHTFYTAKRAMVISHTIHEEKNSNNSFNSTDQQMMDTYSKIVEDPIIAKTARNYLPTHLRKKYSAENLSNLIDTKISQQSLVLTISAKSSDKHTSVEVTNAMAKAMKKDLPSIQPGAGKVRLLSPATNSSAEEVTVPHIKKYVAVGLALGGMVGLIICFVDETWSRLI